MIRPDWPAPANVHAFVTTRAMGDMAGAGREKLRSLVPSDPWWMRQVHGAGVLDLPVRKREGDAAVSRTRDLVCAVMIADCMPVLLADEAGSVVGIAHAGWRGMAAGVLEAAFDAMRSSPEKTLAWLGPAIGPAVYEVGEEVRAAFAGDEKAFVRTRPGHWLLDLYAVARKKLAACGVRSVHGGGYCTYSEPQRFFSYRRDRDSARMAALIWLA